MSEGAKEIKTPKQRIIDCLNYQRGDWFTASDMVSVLAITGNIRCASHSLMRWQRRA